MIVDDHWNLVFVTDAARKFMQVRNGSPMRVGEGNLIVLQDYPGSDVLLANNPEYVRAFCGMMLADLPSGRDEFNRRLNPTLAAMADSIEPIDDDVIGLTFKGVESHINDRSRLHVLAFRLSDAAGRRVGRVLLYKPGGDMGMLIAMHMYLDGENIQRVRDTSLPARRPSAILCADLDGSASLSRRISTATYFEVARQLVLAFDRSVVDLGGLVGRHAGDGVTAFFVSEVLGSESAAARASLEAARLIKDAVAVIASELGLAQEDLVPRFGLHWGSTLYVGAIVTKARFEVTAMGDQVNEAARIEACASGGLTLASKDLVERLNSRDADAMGLDLDRLTYIPLGELSSATEKARRDAPAVAVSVI